MAEWRLAAIVAAIVAEWIRPLSDDLTDKPNPTHGDPPSGLRETTHEATPSIPAPSRSKDGLAVRRSYVNWGASGCFLAPPRKYLK